MSRTIALAFIIVLIASSTALTQTTDATPQPSIPEFTVKQIDNSYGVDPTNTTNPFTGEIIPHQGYNVKQLTIEVTIKNQPFTPATSLSGNVTGLHYNVQAKCSYEGWSTTVYSDSHNKYAAPASTSENTIVSFTIGSPQGWDIPLGSQVEIRVQAVSGKSYTIWSPNGGLAPIGDGFDLEAASGWSSIKTITIGSGEVATIQPTAQPTQTPTAAVPTQTNTEAPAQPEVTSTSGLNWKDIVIVAAFAVIAALAAALVLTRRKKQ